MAATHSNATFQGETPQYAFALAIFSGGVAFIVSQLVGPNVVWLSYTILAALFAFGWPRAAWQWSCWLCLPILLLICFDALNSLSLHSLYNYGGMFVRAFVAAGIGSFVGAKLSAHKITRRETKRRVRRRRARVAPGKAHTAAASALAAASSPANGKHSSAGVQGEPLRPIAPGVDADALNAALLKAVQAGDANSVRRLLADGADVNAGSREQLASHLLNAGAGGEVADGELTLFGDGCAALNATAGAGWTPLMIATLEGRVDIARLLLERGAQTDAEKSRGWTALRFAVSMDETEILRLLLKAGAKVDVADHEGKTALMQAADENSEESLKALLGAGADTHLLDQEGLSALSIAQRRGHANIIRLLKAAAAEASGGIGASQSATAAHDADSLAAPTHRVVRVTSESFYGSMARYKVIPVGAALPHRGEETGRTGNEEECLDFVWQSSIDATPELRGWLNFGNPTNA